MLFYSCERVMIHKQIRCVMLNWLLCGCTSRTCSSSAQVKHTNFNTRFNKFNLEVEEREPFLSVVYSSGWDPSCGVASRCSELEIFLSEGRQAECK